MQKRLACDPPPRTVEGHPLIPVERRVEGPDSIELLRRGTRGSYVPPEGCTLKCCDRGGAKPDYHPYRFGVEVCGGEVGDEYKEGEWWRRGPWRSDHSGKPMVHGDACIAEAHEGTKVLVECVEEKRGRG